ncbi:MAG: hypothetical protein WCM76_06615 [Bacteroidota bacterium]
MLLSELFEKEKQEKVFDVFSKIKDQINSVPQSDQVAAIEYNKKLFLLERQELFFTQNVDPKEKYHWIEAFAREISFLNGGPFTYEEKVERSRNKVLSDYKGHSYLPQIKIFLKQTDEAIVVKLAHLAAYNEICDLFQSHISVIRKALKKNISKSTNPLGNTVSPEVQYRKLFVSAHAFDIAERVIKGNLIDFQGVWKGHTGKFQDVPALVELLEDFGYIKCRSRTAAVKIFCARLNLKFVDRTARSKGYAFDEAITYYQTLFPEQ